MNPTTTPRIGWLLLLAVLIVALWLRAPLISKNLPYFYNEDEAHHFNRTVNMVKEGDLNPHYFHKPSLHFYLRIPVVVGSFFWSVSRGQMRSIQEIKTGDPFGLNGYAMSASHPTIVKWNRAFSVVLSLLGILLTFLIARNIAGGIGVPLFAAAIVAISPGHIADSATIGVDVVMCTFTLLTLLFSLKIESDRSTSLLVFASLCAGLTISSKYNAWPIALLPFFAAILYGPLSITRLLIVIFLVPLGFILGTPYVISELPLFLDHAAYEIWHYKIAEHVGHTGEPGLNQSLFLGRWLYEYGVGLSLFILSSLGILIMLFRPNRKFLLFLIFPVIYFLYMSSQRTNFTRNMIVLVPFIAILGALALTIVSAQVKHNIKRLILVCAVPLLVAAPLRTSLAIVFNEPRAESRLDLEAWLKNVPPFSDTALSGNLNLAPSNYGLKGVTRIDETKITPSQLYLIGFDRIIVGPGFKPADEELSLLHLEKHFPGALEYDRTFQNPEIRVFKFSDNIAKAITDRPGIVSLSPPRCSAEEGHCWINSRVADLPLDLSKLYVRDGKIDVVLQIMTPWPNQSLTLKIADWSYNYMWPADKVGEWVNQTLQIPADRLSFAPSLRVLVSEIHSPLTQKLSADSRRLGVALKGAALLQQSERE